MRSRVDFRLAVPAAAAWAAAALVCGLVAAWVRHLAPAAAAVGLLLGGASAAVHVAAARSGPVAALAHKHRTATLAMHLVRDPLPRTSPHGRSYYLADATVDAVNGARTGAAVLVIGRGDGWRDLLPGQHLQLRGRLSPPRSQDGLSAVVVTSGPVHVVGKAPWWQRAAGVIRSDLRRACLGLPADERGLVPGLVVGDVAAMPPSLTDAFRVSGLTHLNAVSGENCAIVLATVGALVRRTPLTREWRYVVSAVALVGFVVLARPSPSVLRAAVMGGVALFAGAVGRRAQSVPLLAAATVGLLLVDPFLALSPGFALSVLATAAIVLLAPWLTRLLSRWMPRWLAAAIAVPAAAQLACTPVLVLVFGQLTPWAIPANLLAAPAVAPATVAGVTAALVAVVAPLPAQLLAWVAAVPATLVGMIVVAGVAWHRRRSWLHAILGAWPPSPSSSATRSSSSRGRSGRLSTLQAARPRSTTSPRARSTRRRWPR
jgi:competence protein ComEC